MRTLLTALGVAISATQAAAQDTPRLPIRPWIGVSAGFAAIKVDDGGQSGLAGDLVLGVELAGGLRFGARRTSFNAITFMGDQPTWSSTSTIYLTGYKPPRWPVAFTAGVGRLWSDQDRWFAGRTTMLETGFELSMPARHGIAFRAFGSRLWALGATAWTTESSWRPRIRGQVQTGVGLVIH
jgi:hypothetical protein